MKQIALFFVASILLLGLANCDKKTKEPEAPAPTPEKTLISEAFALGSGLLIQYYAYEDFFVGYNKIYLAVKDSISGEKLDNEIAMEILPLMDMGMTIHSCPTEALEYDAENKLYEGAAVYVMPSTDMANWTLDVNINSSTATLFIDVIQPEEAKMVSFQSQLDSTAFYFVSLIKPTDPKVGDNEYQILTNRRASIALPLSLYNGILTCSKRAILSVISVVLNLPFTVLSANQSSIT